MSLVGVQTWDKRDLISVISDPYTLLDNFYFHLYHHPMGQNYDTAMLITLVVPHMYIGTFISILFIYSGIDMDGALGLAPIGFMCRTASCSIVQDTGYSVAYTASAAAHELGHNLNMLHDYGSKQKTLCTQTL